MFRSVMRMDFLRNWRQQRERRRVHALVLKMTQDERAAILARSPYDLYYGQGEAVWLMRKGEPDLKKALLEVLGEPSGPEGWMAMENFLIVRTLIDEAPTSRA